MRFTGDFDHSIGITQPAFFQYERARMIKMFRSQQGINPLAQHGIKVSIETLTFIPFVLFFLFDNYMGGIRVLDFAGFFILLALTALKICQQNGRVHISPEAALIAFFSLTFFGISFLLRQDDAKSHIGVSIGLLVFLCYYSLQLTDSRCLRGIDWVLRMSIASVIFQMIYTKVTGHFPKLVFFNVDEVRAMFAGDQDLLRPTGFFMEPNNYCVPTVMLVLLRRQIQQRPFDLTSYLAIATLFSTLSLWGVFIGWGLIFYDLISRKKKKGALLFVTLTVASFGLLLNTLGDQSFLKRAVLTRTMGVMQSIFSDTGGSRNESQAVWEHSEDEYMRHTDASYEGRYSGHSMSLFRPSQWNASAFFGHGISTTRFQEYGGANGISFLIYSFGLFGMIILLLVIWVSKIRVGIIGTILVSLLSYPLVTYFFWWAWLGLLLRSSSSQARPAIANP